jgi:probable rRNA maturation factor
VQRTGVAGGGAPSAARLRAWALAAAPAGAEVTLRVVGGAEARRLNRDFRGRDYATNVLSFSYAGAQGDIVLCHPVIAREARAQGKALAAHYAHLVVHGMLHLRGRDHRRAADARRMERAEVRILRRLGFGDPYALK